MSKPMSEPPILGIDLGTTFSLVAVLQGDEPVVLPNALGEDLTPSAVSLLDDGSLVVGAAARARATTHPERTVLAFKRDMGTSRTVTLGARSFTAVELSALILRSLREDAERALGVAVEEAVVTVPAYFGDLQRQATKDAGAIAGLRVERIINEPTAAALAYGLHQRDRELRAVVLDLGGGTFDVTLVEIVEGVIEVQGTAGDVRLGGDDFDRAFAAHLRRRISSELGVELHPGEVTTARVVDAAERAKRRLTNADRTSIALPGVETRSGGRADVELECTRKEAEEVWAPLLDRLRAPITRALSDAGVRPNAIDEVLLVGGSTRMPCITQLAAQMFGRLPLRSLPPDEAVALGAAVQAALKQGAAAVEDLVVTDVAPFSMGIATASHFGAQRVTGLFSPVLERGTVIPASRERRFSTVADGQRQLRVEVFQGERSQCRDNTSLGSFTLDGLPARPAGEVEVDVRFTYDPNGILEVEATIVGTGQRQARVFERTEGRLTAEQVLAARKAMQRLKLHPRDALPNTTALARADALFAELVGADREVLAQAIAAFRVALESQEPARYEQARATLAEITAALRR
jgi:molecular chaperone HscC